MSGDTLWDDDDIQFPRLLDELQAVGVGLTFNGCYDKP